MGYEQSKEVELRLPGQEQMASRLNEIAGHLEPVRRIIDDIKGSVNPDSSDFPLGPGEIGVIRLPSDPPSTACVLEHPDTGHWMLQVPCGGIFVADLDTQTATF
jgi:hypothetical protein